TVVASQQEASTCQIARSCKHRDFPATLATIVGRSSGGSGSGCGDTANTPDIAIYLNGLGGPFLGPLSFAERASAVGHHERPLLHLRTIQNKKGRRIAPPALLGDSL